MKKPELLAPAGSWEMLVTAIDSGTDAVYFGIEQLNMRAKAKNFDSTNLAQVVEYCKNRNVKAHLTLNTIVYENELTELDKIIPLAKAVGIDIVICWDMSVIEKCITYDIPFCVSTQASVSNSAAANFYKRLGAQRVVLARECTLEKIKEIKENVDIEIETFVHGAMCIAVSGRCFMSHELFNKSANRGECIQPCRREYTIYDKDGDTSLLMGEDYVLSPKDLCTIEFIHQLIDTGIDSFKIEGRKRSPEYIAKVVSTYRKAIDLHANNKLTTQIKEKMKEELAKVYNRGFSSGFYFGTPTGEDYADIYGSKATTKKVYVGKVLNYYKKSKIAHVKLEASDLPVGSDIYIIGETTGALDMKVNSLLVDEHQTLIGQKGSEVTFPCENFVRERDRVYKIIEIDN